MQRYIILINPPSLKHIFTKLPSNEKISKNTVYEHNITVKCSNLLVKCSENPIIWEKNDSNQEGIKKMAKTCKKIWRC